MASALSADHVGGSGVPRASGPWRPWWAPDVPRVLAPTPQVVKELVESRCGCAHAKGRA